MKTQLLTTLLILVTSLGLNAQTTYYYAYDAAGNRIARSDIPFRQTRAQLEENKEEAEPIVYEEKVGEQNIKIYPNPTRGVLSVEFLGFSGDDANKTGMISIYTMDGKTVLLSNNVTTATTYLDISSYARGMYLMRIQLGEVVREWRIIKE